MKKLIHIILIVSLLLSCLAHPILASNTVNARWQNTLYVFCDPQYYNGSLECYVNIEAELGATIENVSISLDKVMGSGLVNVASWSNLSGNYRFTFYEIVPGAELECIYRLSVTADVILNGVVEHIDVYEEEFYVEE